MSGTKVLKRSSPATDDDGPIKKKPTNNKLGRPRNVAGDEQYEYMMSGLPDYLVEKHKKLNKQPHKISRLYDEKTFDFIAKFGWENPFGASKGNLRTPTAADRAAAEAEAAEASKAVANGPTGMDEEKFAEQKRKDEVVALVRGEITKLYQRAVRDGDAERTKPSVDIPKLIKSIMAKPTQRQLYMVWAKLRARPDLESEVDKRHQAAIKEKGSSSRGAVWNIVASEWFNACSEDEKVITRREALKILDIETEKWEDQAASEPSSPEEARAFMEGSEEFLRAMMQFFANRVSGIAVMFLAGPAEVNLSEAVCETPGQPKVLYSHIAEEETTLRLMGGRILSQSRLLAERKWGVQLGEDDLPEQDGAKAVPMDVDVDLHIDPALRQQQTTSNEPGATEPASAVPEIGENAHVTKTAEIVPGRSEQADHALAGMETARASVRQQTAIGAESTAGSTSVPSEPAPMLPPTGGVPSESENEPPFRAAMVAAEVRLKLARAKALQAKAEAEAAEAEAAVLAEAAAQPPTANMASTFQDLEPVDTAMQSPVATGATTTTPPSADKATSNESIMTFDPCASLARMDGVESKYEAVFEQASLALTIRKAWWDQTNNPAFFRGVPQKLRLGGVDVAVGCELSLAYLALEQSGATENPLAFVSGRDDSACLPEYLVTFGLAGRVWGARWHKRTEMGAKRTRAALDADINVTLPRQWAALQPHARLDAHGRIAMPAHASMVWPSGLSPGRQGVRTLVVTLLNWGSHVTNKENERVEWRLVAADVAQVLRILAQKGGECESSAPGGRKKLPSVKARDVNRSD